MIFMVFIFSFCFYTNSFGEDDVVKFWNIVKKDLVKCPSDNTSACIDRVLEKNIKNLRVIKSPEERLKSYCMSISLMVEARKDMTKNAIDIGDVALVKYHREKLAEAIAAYNHKECGRFE